jgi:amino acid adenylation domain-containing protein
MSTYPQEFTVCTPVLASETSDACVPKCVAAKATNWPDAIALTAGSRVLNYGELDCQANRIAHHLRSLGVRPGVLVGLCLPRSVEMAAAALGIWKAGGAFVPMDPAYPPARLAFMLADAQAPLLVTDASLGERLPDGNHVLVYLDSPQIAKQPDYAPRVAIMPHDLAYVIYTSGSTGKPKGVEITHAGLANLVAWHRQAFAVTCGDRASHLAGLGFDAAVWELWPYLAAGASVHMVDDLTRNSAELLRDWLLARKITISFVPTPLAERLVAFDWPTQTPLRVLLTGGDTLHHHPPANLPFTLVNNYGPTECTVVATSGVVPPDARANEAPSIGRAIARTRIYLLDERLQPAPHGTPGEIYIAGAGLARRYHNRPDLTSERFIPNPFSSEAGAMLYKTGDLGRMLPDGQIAFLGRVDDQIKIRGYRIEPNEIIRALDLHPDVRQSVVTACDDASGDKQLVAYVLLERGSAATHTALRDFLRGVLPEYMLPAGFVRLDALPLTAHGKIDRAVLPAPDSTNTLPDNISASELTGTEERVAKILTALLGRDQIGPDDNFFLLGGHSLLGAQLIVRLREVFGVEISLRSLFDAPTVAALSAELERLKSSGKTLERERLQPCASTCL